MYNSRTKYEVESIVSIDLNIIRSFKRHYLKAPLLSTIGRKKDLEEM